MENIADSAAQIITASEGRFETAIAQRTDEWYAARRSRLTASDFAAAIGICPYKSRQQLWLEKTGRATHKESEYAERLRRYGQENEPVAISLYEVETGNIVLPVGLVCHPTLDWIAASPDGLLDANGIIEVKCRVSQEPYREIPAHYRCQIQGQLECTGRLFCDFVSWRDGDISIIRERRNEKFWRWMLKHLQAFWRFVQEDRKPPRLSKKPVFGDE